MRARKWDVGKSERRLKALEEVLKNPGDGSMLILCHNNPDPDTIASAWGLQFIVRKLFQIKAVIGYGGAITRAENQAMVSRLRIKMDRLTSVDRLKYSAIAAVDHQHSAGQGLLDPRGEPPTIVIDHHPMLKLSRTAAFRDIRPSYGSTSTIITEYLVAAGLVPSRPIANALLYGIKTDTNSLLRRWSPQDLNAFTHLSPLTNPRVLARIEQPPIPKRHFEYFTHGFSVARRYGDAVISYLGPVDADAIVPELADHLLRVDGVHWSLCLASIDEKMILSLRSSSKKRRAGTVAARILAGQGYAGGHKEMGAGQIGVEALTDDEKDAFALELIRRFLKIIGREGKRARSLLR